MRQHVLKTYSQTLDLARRLVADVPCERFTETPHAGAKHPGWVLGHLCIGSNMGASILGAGASGPSDAWMDACKPGSELQAQRDVYATKDELLDELNRVHDVFGNAFSGASDEQLAAPFPMPEYRSFFPTVGDAAFYLLAYHEGWHLGQLSAWRLAAGFGAPTG